MRSLFRTWGRARPSVFSLVVLVLVGLLGYVGLSGWDRGVRAARGEGAPGVFVAESLSCVRHPGHESCVCQGTFTPENSGEERSVRLHAAQRSDCASGAEVASVDSGAADRVYGPWGSREWVFSAVLVSIAVGATVVIMAGWFRPRRESEEADSGR